MIPARPAPDPDRPAADPDRPPPHLDPVVLALVFAGGVAGALARYGIGRALTDRPHGFPLATFLVNLSGALALGVVLAVVPAASRWKYLLATGFLGAYTTYSALVVDTDRLGRHGHVGIAVGYSVGSVLLGLGLAAVGGAVLRRRSA